MQIAPPAVARPLRIVLPGGSGQTGTLLAQHFQQSGHHVTVLTRGPYTAPWQTVYWDGVSVDSWTETLEGADLCINMAGPGPHRRTRATTRQAQREFCIRATNLLGLAIGRLGEPPRMWMNASTVAIYPRVAGHEQDEESETDAGTPGSMARLAIECEAAFFAQPTPRTRKVALRSAAILASTPGSAFATLSNVARAGLGGTHGSGRQFVSWIHALDFARAVEFLMAREDVDGPVNLAAPDPLPNRDFMKALREAWDRPNGLPTPAFAVRLAACLLAGDAEFLLKSRYVTPGRLLDAGFDFTYPRWPEAAEDLVRQWGNRE